VSPRRPAYAAITILAVVISVLSAAVACASPAPSGTPTATATPTPGDLSAVQAALALRGVTIHEAVSGDAGCPGQPGLHGNAVRFELSLAGDDQPYEVFLFRWRRPSDFAAAEQSFADCVDEYTAGVSGDVSIDGVEVAPFRAYGPGWSEDLISVLEQALHDVGGG
jgi:hypothetical protein